MKFENKYLRVQSAQNKTWRKGKTLSIVARSGDKRDIYLLHLHNEENLKGSKFQRHMLIAVKLKLALDTATVREAKRSWQNISSNFTNSEMSGKGMLSIAFSTCITWKIYMNDEHVMDSAEKNYHHYHHQWCNSPNWISASLPASSVHLPPLSLTIAILYLLCPHHVICSPQSFKPY
jgi:hypothetical protein